MDRHTVEVYEASARAWRDRRPARYADDAVALARAVAPGALRADLGCGAGAYVPHLAGGPVLALDAAHAMVRLTVGAHPEALGVRSDLERLPVRRGALGGAWARASYVHVPAERVPAALAQLHVALAVDAPFAGSFLAHDDQFDPATHVDDFPGRYFSAWEPARLADVVTGAGFTLDALTSHGEWLGVRATRARTLPDFVGPDLAVLVCGLNPSVHAADRGVGFARPGNRFWPAALAAGLVSRDRDPLHAFSEHRVGMTDLVKRATPNARALTRDEYREGADRVRRLVEWLAPAAVCFVGLTGWRAAVDPRAVVGWQPERFGGRPAYVMPNTSGVNAHAQLPDLVEHLRAVIAGP